MELELLYDIINKYEKQFLESKGDCSDKIWFIKKNKIQEELDIQISEQELGIFFGAGLRACRLKCSHMILAVESILRKFENKEDVLYALENFDTERPSVYPESMREHFLGFLVLDNKEQTVRFLVHDIIKNPAGELEFKDEMRTLGTEMGFGMIDIIIKMYIDGFKFKK